MAKPTVQNVLDTARSYLGDDAIPGGEWAQDSVLLPFFGLAYRELFRAMQQTQNPFIRQDSYYVLPANTSVLDPAVAGITDLADLEFVEERSAGTIHAITGATAGAQYMTLTVPNHGYGTGNEVVVYNLQGFSPFNSPNNLWTINVVDVNTFQLLGCTATGTWINGTGSVAQSPEEFITMDPYDRIEKIPFAPGPTLNAYAWEGDVLRFIPSSSARQLRIVYTLSGSVPSTSAIIGVDDSLDFLAVRTAGLAAGSRGATERAMELNSMAIGPDLVADGNGGMLRELLIADIRAMQRLQYRRPPFRRRRNVPDAIYY